MITSFIDRLKEKPSGTLFNPWYETDPENDKHPDAPSIRRKQLAHYLQERVGKAKYLMIAEALGYQGGHFTGIAMTSERILLGHQRNKYSVHPNHVFQTISPARTSKVSVAEKGMTEPTATIMWGALTDLGIDPYEVVLWNAVPWHPYNPNKGLLSNRTPLPSEMEAGLRHLKEFITIFENAQLIAVGRKCEQSLSQLGEKHAAVRHPANGGAPKFRRQLLALAKGIGN
ncbi:uracil-DNA glycosylase [Rhodohalobacter sp. SW132]|uniref:uracil-DNA glycosylase n=1 Tax=Rhodohalobacter sp. SW132 TaxID=2293433 RepID=UPI000E272FFE|nr:uracil-DNA glycosylase [Rhodohalobacter sp. SW132]REL25081.1 uracil-DNA glycosylase [Rhodohalobacter sp. SW132]